MRDNANTDRQVRLLILWESPLRSSTGEVRAWAEPFLAPLRADERVERVALLPLRAPTDDHALAFGWLLELHVGLRSEAAELVRQGPLRGLLGDLRLLRVGPAVLLADEAD